MLTSDRRAEILVGPAGSGKTRTAALRGQLWREAGMGEVYGLATSQAARNVLRDAGVDDWRTTPRSSSATWKAGGKPAARGRSRRGRC